MPANAIARLVPDERPSGPSRWPHVI